MNKRFISILAAILLLATAGCNSSSGSSSGSGDLKVSLTDAPSPDYKAVYVTVNQVEVKASADENDNGWQVIDIDNKTINLLDLTGGILETLGTRNLAAGDYNQLRLHLATAPDDKLNLNDERHDFPHYVIETDGTIHELKVPSGYQSGIKLVKGFTIVASELTELILDFDATKSVVKAGNSGKWLLKPVIRVIDTVTVAGIQGTVTDAADDSLKHAAWVAVQTYDGTAADAKDDITTDAATLTDETGDYLLRVPADNYTLVAFKDGFAPECRTITATTGTTLTEDFALTAADSGILTVSVSGLTEVDDSVTVSVRKESACGGTETIFYEMTSQSFAENGSFDISLPPDTYTMVAYGDNLTTLSETKVITSGDTTTLAVSL
jgi:hypothetical protein